MKESTRCANSKFKTDERNKFPPNDWAKEESHPPRPPRTNKKKKLTWLAESCLPCINHSQHLVFNIVHLSLSPSFLILLPQIPLSLQAYILSPRRSLIISATLHPNSLSYLQDSKFPPRHQHVNEGGSIALETPGAHRIGDWRLGY